jgi:glycine/D-amino acid oxidase-like deaminating enzyme
MRYPFPDNSGSYWLKDGTKPTYPTLSEDIEVDVVIVGGGITGLTIAHSLKQTGRTVAVLERRTIAGGTTSGTTGKVTAQHGIAYADLVRRFGVKDMQLYADIYMQAMREMEALVESENFDCEWSKQDNYVYTADREKVGQFKDEAAVAASLGLPASFETDLHLPFEVRGAVKFADQAQFSSTKYCQELAKRINGEGSYVYEQSKAIGFEDGSPAHVKTAEGSVTAKHIIIATLVPTLPLIGRVTYGLFESPQTSYIVAGKTDSTLEGMYISPDKDHYSILPVQDGGERYILIGGGAHLPGMGRSEPRFDKLSEYATKWFDVKTVAYKWGAMDYTAYDKLPLVGKLYPWSKNMYTATGFKKWGLSTSMVAAIIIRDLLDGRTSPVAHFFRTHRASAPLSIPQNIINTIKGR